jgi:hypothetical protein
MKVRTLRPVNIRLGNLNGHTVTLVCHLNDQLAIQFEPLNPDGEAFCVQLTGVIHSVENRLIRQPLTAGVVWPSVSSFGRTAAARSGRENLTDLIELRLDYENKEGLQCLFQAVAVNATVWDGTLADKSGHHFLNHSHKLVRQN